MDEIEIIVICGKCENIFSAPFSDLGTFNSKCPEAEYHDSIDLDTTCPNCGNGIQKTLNSW